MKSLITPRRNPSPAASNQAGQESDVVDMSEDLAHLVKACQAGDSNAQRQLFDACHQQILRLVMRMVGRQDASDLVQQTFLQMYRTIHQFSGRSRFDTWLYRLAVNECLQFLRRAKRAQFETLVHELADGSASQSLRTEDHELLEVALDRIDDELRCIFVLREIEGLKYCEIAEVMGIVEGTVASRLNRAREQLRQHLVELGWDCQE